MLPHCHTTVQAADVHIYIQDSGEFARHRGDNLQRLAAAVRITQSRKSQTLSVACP